MCLTSIVLRARIMDMKRLLFALLLMLGCLVHALEPGEVVVVYNADSALSRETAETYCRLRSIPETNLIPLYGLGRGDISRADYDAKVKLPLMALGKSRGIVWPAGVQGQGRRVRAMVLMPDLPLRIKEEPVNGKLPGNGIPVNGAALDSELMLLGAEYPLAKHGSNPYYGKEALPAAGERQVVMSVCRIDGPNKECIARMIHDPISVERAGLWGWIVVDSGGPYKAGDDMMTGVVDFCKGGAIPVFHESSKATLANDFPLMPETSLYFGWYANPANGPFGKEAKGGFRFVKGALAFHLHSYSATSLYDGNSWVSALLNRGACVTAGNVSEPFLGACINYSVLFSRLIVGYSLGEAALMASPTVSWQCIVLGDPLYRPYTHKAKHVPQKNDFVMWLVLNRQHHYSIESLEPEVQKALSLPHGAHFAEMFAWRFIHDNELEKAEKYLRLAQERYTATRDKLRVSLILAAVLNARGEAETAKNLMQQVQQKYGKSPYAAAIQRSAESIMRK